MPTDKPVTVRIPHSQLRELMGLTVLDGGNLADQIRTAITRYVDDRLAAPDLNKSIADAQERQSHALEALLKQR